MRLLILFLALALAAGASEIVTCSITDSMGNPVSTDCVDPGGRWRAQAFGPNVFVTGNQWDVRSGAAFSIGPVTPGFVVTITGDWVLAGSLDLINNDEPAGTLGAYQFMHSDVFTNEHTGDDRGVTGGSNVTLLASPANLCTPTGFQMCEIDFTYGTPLHLSGAVSVTGSLTSDHIFSRSNFEETQGFLLGTRVIGEPVPEGGTLFLSGLGLAVLLYSFRKRGLCVL